MKKKFQNGSAYRSDIYLTVDRRHHESDLLLVAVVARLLEVLADELLQLVALLNLALWKERNLEMLKAFYVGYKPTIPAPSHLQDYST